jgi:mannobiose 2-epimerase
MDWLKLQTEIKDELCNNILPYWMNHMKNPDGGLYGNISNSNITDGHAPRGLVMTSRFLWTYSEAYRIFGKKEYLDFAIYVKDTLLKTLYDREQGGFFWSADGYDKPLDNKKVLYGQAFALYGLSTFQMIAPSDENADLCKEIFTLLETHGKDPVLGGYYEALNRDWTYSGKNNLGADDIPCEKSMNTNLHMLEAYTRYFLQSADKEVKKSLIELISIIMEKIYDPLSGHQKLYFSKDWEPIGDVESYGHDVETSWLLWEALEILENKPLQEKYRKMVLTMLDVSSDKATAPDGSLYNEKKGEHLDTVRIWWVQAEYAVSLMNGWMMTGKEKYKEKLSAIWNYIKENQIDNENGEWFWGILDNGTMVNREKGGMWKTPYHNGRACMELIQRINKITDGRNV